MADVNDSIGKCGGKRQLIRLNFHKQQHGDVLGILDKCTNPMKCDLVAEALRFYSKNYMHVLIGGDEMQSMTPPPPAAATEIPKQDSISDVFNKVTL